MKGLVACILTLGLASCVRGELILPAGSSAPFAVDLAVGTEWVYAESSDGAQLDRARVRVERETWYWFKTIGIDLGWPVVAERRLYKAAVIGKPVRVSADRPGFGSSLGSWSNSTAGLVFIRGHTDPSGVLLVPSENSPAKSYWYIDEGWSISNWDTLMSVPAGTYRCIEKTYRGAPFGGYTEYWAPRVGLIRRILRGLSFPGEEITVPRERDWQLIEYHPGGQPRHELIPAGL